MPVPTRAGFMRWTARSAASTISAWRRTARKSTPGRTSPRDRCAARPSGWRTAPARCTRSGRSPKQARSACSRTCAWTSWVERARTTRPCRSIPATAGRTSAGSARSRIRRAHRRERPFDLGDVLERVGAEDDGEGFPVEVVDPLDRRQAAVLRTDFDHHDDGSPGRQGGLVGGAVEDRQELAMNPGELPDEAWPGAAERIGGEEARRDRSALGPVPADELAE